MQEKSLAFWEKLRRFSAFFRSPEWLRRCFQKIHTFLSVKRPADMLYYKYEKAREGTFGMERKIGFSKVPWLGVLAGLLGYFFHATMLSGGSAIPADCVQRADGAFVLAVGGDAGKARAL